MSTTLAPPLAVFHSISECDKHPGHEVQLTTDGRLAYACGPVTDTGMLVSRVGSVLTVTCAQPDLYDEPCIGEARFDLSDDDAGWPGWTTDEGMIRRVIDWGKAVD